MYTEYVSKLYLNKAKLRFVKHDQEYPYDTMVKELGTFCPVFPEMNGFSPDYLIRGQYASNGTKFGTFSIEPRGEHLLLITGVRSDSDNLEKFKMPVKVLFSSYWEQNTLGYLFQIIKH